MTVGAEYEYPANQSDESARYHYLKTFPSFTAFIEDVAPIIKRCAEGTNKYGNLITALATVVIAVFTAKLWSVGNQQGITMQDQLRISERPYVANVLSDKGNAAEWITDASGTKTGIDMYFINVGNTPAEHFLINGSFTFDQVHKFIHLEPAGYIPEREFHKRFPHTSELYAVGNDTIPAKSKPMPIPVGIINAQDISDELKRANPPHMVFGSFEYVDIFGEYCCVPLCLKINAQQRFERCQVLMTVQLCPPDYVAANICSE
jgi:hypothetical protein